MRVAIAGAGAVGRSIARELVEKVGPELAALFTYPGDQHLFTDSSLPSYDRDATAVVLSRSREFLDRVS